jgi:hypothetical protein
MSEETSDETSDFEDFVWEQLPEGGILGSYIVLAEVLSEEGVHLMVTAREGTQPWTAMGMLVFAQESIAEKIGYEEENMDLEIDDEDLLG